MTEVKCPNCKKIFIFDGEYDETFNTERICSHCGWKASGFTFEYIKERPKTFSESIIHNS